MRLTGAEGSLVRELDDRDGLLHVRTGRGIRAGRPEFPLRLGQGAQGAAALRREPVWNTDVLAQELPGYGEEMPGSGRLMREVIRERGYRAVLALPMVSRDTLFGSLAVYWAEPHAPTGREIRLLEAFAQQAAVAVEHARLYAAARARVEHLETLARLNRLISSSLARDRVLAEICRSAAQLMQVPNVLFWVADEETRILTPVGFSDPAVAERFPVTTLGFGEGLVGWVAAHRQPLNLRDVFADRRLERPDIWRAEGMRAFHGIPVVFEGALLGVLALVGREPIGLATPVQALLEGLVAQAAVAIRNASLYEAEGRARREAELALAQVKQLQGMLPICAYCKKVRNDRNYWEQIETYIGERSQATFSHGICPDCRESIVKPQLEQWKAEQRQQRGG
jgi:GAF domain-containing protein